MSGSVDVLAIITGFIASIVIYNISLLYGTVGEIMIEKSGSLNLGVEGTMAIGAILGYLAGCMTNNFFLAVIVSFIGAGLCGLIFAVLTVTLQANQNVTGLTMTTFGIGLYFFIGRGLGDKWPALLNISNMKAANNQISIPLLSKIPVIGEAFFNRSILTYIGIIIAVLAWAYLKYTKYGLKLRAVGENPATADSAGVKVTIYKYVHIIIGSGIMGIGGLNMGLILGGSFEGSTCWINGYGWIAIALVIFANWNPSLAILGTFVFGLFNSLQYYSGSLVYAFPHALGWLSNIPSQFFKALPFIITAIVLIISSINKNRSAQPSAIGMNYFREDR